MTTITLHKYLQKIDELIDEHRLEEAINHCRHILQQHPRHVDTYRTLAKAYLERGNYEESVDLTQRILSTDPSDLIAHVGLSIAFKAQSQLDPAIWHLERALDIEPYNGPLREELQELYMLKKAAVPDSVAPSSAALARMYLKSEMYNAAVMQLRQALAAEPDRIDLKVLLAETLWWANERVDAVGLSLDILDVLPNCIPVNAVLAEIWLQTGRVAEAQTYLKRLQAMTLVDKAHCDPETAVGRALTTRGAPPLPEEVVVEQYGEDLLEPESAAPVIAEVNSDWIEEFSLEDTLEETAEEQPPDEEEELGTTGWLTEAALSTGEKFGTQPLVMPSDPLEAESNWFVDPGDEDDESLDELLEDVADDAQLDDWLAGLPGEETTTPAVKPEIVESTGFTGMLSGLLDSELDAAEDTAVPSDFTDLFDEDADWQAEESDEETAVAAGFTDLFADMPEPQVEDESVLNLAEQAELDLDQFLDDADDLSLTETEEETAGDSFAEGLTALFSDMDDAEPTAPDSLAEGDDIDLDEFLASDLGTLAEPDETGEEDEHTGYTQLFDQLSTDPFPEELESLDSDWLTPTTDALSSDLTESPDDEDAPDWLAEVKEDEFEPVQIDPKLTADWLTESGEALELPDEAEESDWLTALSGDEPDQEPVSESGWLSGLAGDEPEMELTGESDWLSELAGDEPETEPAPQPADLEDLADISTWMLAEEQGAQTFETPAPSDVAESTGFDTDELEESTAVPTWLLGGDKSSEETGALGESGLLDDTVPPESSQMREKPQTILAREELPDWLRQSESDEQGESAPLSTDSADSPTQEELPDWLSSEQPEQAAPEAETTDPLDSDSMANLVSGELPSWLVDDEPDVTARPIPEPDSELDIYKDDINIPDWLMADLSIDHDQTEVAVTGDKDEQEFISPQKPESSPDSTPEPGDEDGLRWLEELAGPADESAELKPEEEPESASYASRVAAGEGAAVEEPPTQVSMPDELPDADSEPADFDWLSELGESDSEPIEEDLTLDWSQAESKMDDVLAGVTGELNADLVWLDSLAEESVEPIEAADDVPAEFDSGTGLLNDLAGDTGPLDELGEKPILPDFNDSLAALPEEPDDSLDWLSGLDSMEAPEESLPELVDLDAPISDDLPGDVDDGLDWLAELAVEQDMSVEELSDLSDALETEPGADAAQEQVDESLDWLDVVSDEAGGAEIESGLETDFSTVTGPEVGTGDLAMEDLEDIEEAMAWLEGLAAKQGARLEELPSMAGDPTAELVNEEMAPTPDDSMEWLDELAEETADDADILQALNLEEDELESVDADLDWLEAVEEPEDGPEQVDEEPEPETSLAEDENLDEAMVWLEALATEQSDDAVSEPVELEAEEEPEPAFDDMPADLDDAMSWLEDLAAEQSTPLEDFPTIAGVVDEEPGPEPGPDEPADELAEALDWLEQFALKDGGSAVSVPVKETAVPTPKDELSEALDWLEQLAQTEKEPDEPAADVMDLADLTEEMPEDPDEALAWLQQIAAEQEKVEAGDEEDVGETAVDLFEAPPLVDAVESETETEIEEDLEDLFGAPLPEEAVEPETETEVELETAFDELTETEIEEDILAEMPDDPDAAMAWLEKLAARQGARLEELPSVTAEDIPPLVEEPQPEPESEVPTDWADDLTDLFEVDEETPVQRADAASVVEAAVTTEMDETLDTAEPEAASLPETDLTDSEAPEDLDDAMAWLEKLAAQQGARLEELPSVSAEDMPLLVEEPQAEPASESEVPTDLADDLTDLFEADEETPALRADATTEIDEGTTESEAAGLSDADLAELEAPEDLDDAMAWLEALAAQQGARLEELPTLAGTGELPLESIEEAGEETVPDTEDVLAETSLAEAAEETPVEPSVLEDEMSTSDEERFVDEAELSEGIDEALPDWLQEDEAELSEGIDETLPEWLEEDEDDLADMPGQTQWLRDLDEPDVEGWLDEEETTISSSYDRTVRARFDTQPDTAFDTGPLTPVADTTFDTNFFDAPENEFEISVVSLDDDQLELARQSVENGLFDEALQAYQTLVDAGGGLFTLIADLEAVAAEHPEQQFFHHLLGDAYMRNGQLQKALDTYRLALDQI